MKFSLQALLARSWLTKTHRRHISRRPTNTLEFASERSIHIRRILQINDMKLVLMYGVTHYAALHHRRPHVNDRRELVVDVVRVLPQV